MYYTASWQLIEEEVNDDVDQNAVIDREVQYVWGLRYIDDTIMRRENTDPASDDDFDDKIRYYCTDVQFSPIAILDDAAAEVERISYTPYGVARHHPQADIDGDGKVELDDLNAVIGNWGNFGIADIDRSGTVGNPDLNAVIGQWHQEEPAGDISFPAEDNIIGYDGYVFDEETQGYCVRFRHYIPELGRWAERDPIVYGDGMNLMQYALSNATRFTDPSGLCSGCGDGSSPGAATGDVPNDSPECNTPCCSDETWELLGAMWCTLQDAEAAVRESMRLNDIHALPILEQIAFAEGMPVDCDNPARAGMSSALHTVLLVKDELLELFESLGCNDIFIDVPGHRFNGIDDACNHIRAFPMQAGTAVSDGFETILFPGFGAARACKAAVIGTRSVRVAGSSCDDAVRIIDKCRAQTTTPVLGRWQRTSGREGGYQILLDKWKKGKLDDCYDLFYTSLKNSKWANARFLRDHANNRSIFRLIDDPIEAAITGQSKTFCSEIMFLQRYHGYSLVQEGGRLFMVPCPIP